MWIHQEETKRISYIDQLEIQISDGGYELKKWARNGAGPANVPLSAGSITSTAARPGHKAAMKRWNLPRGTWR